MEIQHSIRMMTDAWRWRLLLGVLTSSEELHQSPAYALRRTNLVHSESLSSQIIDASILLLSRRQTLHMQQINISLLRSHIIYQSSTPSHKSTGFFSHRKKQVLRHRERKMMMLENALKVVAQSSNAGTSRSNFD